MPPDISLPRPMPSSPPMSLLRTTMYSLGLPISRPSRSRPHFTTTESFPVRGRRSSRPGHSDSISTRFVSCDWQLQTRKWACDREVDATRFLASARAGTDWGRRQGRLLLLAGSYDVVTGRRHRRHVRRFAARRSTVVALRSCQPAAVGGVIVHDEAGLIPLRHRIERVRLLQDLVGIVLGILHRPIAEPLGAAIVPVAARVVRDAPRRPDSRCPAPRCSA